MTNDDSHTDNNNDNSDNKKIKMSRKLTVKKEVGAKAKKGGTGGRVKDKTDGNVRVFIDASYFIFYRYNATKAWYKHSNRGENDVCHIDNPEFVESFSKHFRDCVEKIEKKFGTNGTNGTNGTKHVYWFVDSPRESLWRMPLFPEYKSHRDKVSTPEIGPFFKYSFENLVPVDKQLKVHRTEADDVAGISAKWEYDNFPDSKIVVVTGDCDYLQLVNDRIRVVKLPKLENISLGVQLSAKNGGKFEVTPEIYLEMKILMGDKSDGIPAVFGGCGPKSAYDIATDRDKFREHIESNEDRYRKYLANRKLICFDEIPDELKGEIISKYISLRF